MRIFYQYSTVSKLTPTRGDFINEINIIKALKRFGHVIYNNTKPRCDISYVRANPKLFMKLKHPKIYFASPYHPGAFKQADAIATFSSEWTKRLKEGKPNTAGCSIKINKPVFTMQQVIDENIFKPLQDHPKTKKIRRGFGGEFVIGHFGKMRTSNFPHTFLKILPALKKEYPNIKIIFSDKSGIGSKLIDQRSFIHSDMPYVLSACDLLLFPYWSAAGHYAGALRIKEAMAVSVPITSPQFMAREEELGTNYEFFYPVGGKAHFRKDVIKGFYDSISLAIEDENKRKEVGKRLHKRSSAYTIGACAKRFERDFKKVIG